MDFVRGGIKIDVATQWLIVQSTIILQLAAARTANAIKNRPTNLTTAP
jgi:hypothetical protein